MRTNRRTFPAVEVVPTSPATRLDLVALFDRSAHFELDLGCGDGTFLAALAAQWPERDFLGVERSPSRIRAACRKIGDGQLANARVLRSGILEALQQLLPPASIEVCHLLFPDPWPKRRHHNRRVVTKEFLVAVQSVLVPDGALRIATDDTAYFNQMQEVIAQTKGFAVSPSDGDGPASTTTFEERFRARGAEIHRVVLRKLSGPDEEQDCRTEAGVVQ